MSFEDFETYIPRFSFFLLNKAQKVKITRHLLINPNFFSESSYGDYGNHLQVL